MGNFGGDLSSQEPLVRGGKGRFSEVQSRLASVVSTPVHPVDPHSGRPGYSFLVLSSPSYLNLLPAPVPLGYPLSLPPLRVSPGVVNLFPSVLPGPYLGYYAVPGPGRPTTREWRFVIAGSTKAFWTTPWCGVTHACLSVVTGDRGSSPVSSFRGSCREALSRSRVPDPRVSPLSFPT